MIRINMSVIRIEQMTEHRWDTLQHKYLVIYFQVSAYGEPQMNADKRRCLSAADSSASIRVHPRSVKAVFPGKNPGKLLAGYLIDYVKADWPKLIRDMFDLTDKQIADIMDYIETHCEELETGYRMVLPESYPCLRRGYEKAWAKLQNWEWYDNNSC